MRGKAGKREGQRDRGMGGERARQGKLCEKRETAVFSQSQLVEFKYIGVRDRNEPDRWGGKKAIEKL